MSRRVARLRESECDIREKPIMDESGYFLYSPTDQLREPFVVTQLAEEVIAAGDDELPSF